jgi:hypothetical protein
MGRGSCPAGDAPLRGFAGGGICAVQLKGSQHVAQQHSRKLCTCLVTAIIKATAWYEVRSFFVATVLKKLRLALSSETVGGARIYRVMTRIKSNPAPAVS